MIKHIELSSRKYPGLVATVDAHFWEMELHSYGYSPSPNGSTYYAIRSYWRGETRTTASLHQDVMRLAGIPVPKGMMIDHEDGNGLNCLLDNLRVVTNSQNSMNRRSSVGSTSKYLGVSWYRAGSNWQAYIKVDGQSIGLGRFDSEIEAAIAYDFAAWIHFGPYARLNCPGYWTKAV